MKIILINPHLVVQRNDPFTTGIVYMPVMLAYAAAALKNAGFDVDVIDSYAENPKQVKGQDKFWIFGLSEDEILRRIPQEASLVILYASNVMSHLSCVNIIRAIHEQNDQVRIAVLENSQAVTAYALDQVAEEFYEAGADFILTGEMENGLADFSKAVSEQRDQEYFRQINGVGFPGHAPERPCSAQLDALPFPAWDLFPLESYWRLGFAHGPLSAKRYLPLLSSRGCPFSCQFCVTPAISGQHWRGRSAENVVDEMELMIKNFNVHEFHFEDLNPTVSDDRIRQICDEVIRRKLRVVWKLAAGTKAETICGAETIALMAKAGCRYISISPESGSAAVLKKMGKCFDFLHAEELIRAMSLNGIFSQACLVLGFPGETPEDLKMTRDLVRQWTRTGIDEIALFMITPVPGSAIYRTMDGYGALSELNFTPSWRSDYRRLNRFRLRLYFCFLLWKLWYHPLKFIMHGYRFFSRRFMLKMEMVPFRAMKLRWWTLFGKKSRH